MLFSNKNMLIFIAVPKTGTSAISRNLQESDCIERNSITTENIVLKIKNEHISALELRKLIGSSWPEFEKVAFVRNPYSRVVSSYFFYKNGRASRQVWQKDRVKLRMIFNVILAKLLPFNLWVWVKPMKQCCDYLCDQEGELIVDRVFKLENVDEGYSYLCQKIGVKPSALEKVNQSSHRCYKSYYGRITRKLISKRFKDDIRIFGYEFHSQSV